MAKSQPHRWHFFTGLGSSEIGIQGIGSNVACLAQLLNP